MGLNFFVADVQNGMGPYIALFLQSSVGWNPAQIGAVLGAGNIAQVLAQTPAGALIDDLRQKRSLILIIGGAVLICIGCLATGLFTTRLVVASAQVLIASPARFFPSRWRRSRSAWSVANGWIARWERTRPSTPPGICAPRLRSAWSVIFLG